MKIRGATGEVLWSEFWGPSSAWNESAFALDVDSQGNLIVGGRQYIDGNNDDFLVLKFDGADGGVIWDYTLDGSSGGLEDRVWDVIVDGDDNILATGIAFGNDGEARFCTFKLDSAGNQDWVREEPGAVQNATPAGWLALDAAANTIMVNRSWVGGQAYNVVSRKYASDDGHTIWEGGYDSPSHGTDDPRGMNLDAAGDILVAGVSNSDYMTLKFDQDDGGLIWSAGYDGPPGWYDLANYVVESPSGEILVTGFSSSEVGGWDVLIQALDADSGDELWTARYNGDDDLTDEGVKMICSDLGDLYLLGYSYSYTTDQDQLIIRYSFGTTDLPAQIVEDWDLSAWPNPFHGSANLRLSLELEQRLEVGIFDIQGRRVRALGAADFPSGASNLAWDGRDDAGRTLPSGIYFARAGELGGVAKGAKLMLLR